MPEKTVIEDITDNQFIYIPMGPSGKGNSEIAAVITQKKVGDAGYYPEKETEARRYTREQLDIPHGSLFGVIQKHGKKVHAVGYEKKWSPFTEGDGLCTSDKNVYLSVTVADCLPIFLYDSKKRAFSVLHSGWKGTGIIEAGIKTMQDVYGINASDLHVCMGPGIGPCCYVVDKNRARYFQDNFGDNAAEWNENGWRLNLIQANKNILKKYNVAEIKTVDTCTACSKLLGSFRREGNNFTRMAAIIGAFNIQ